MTDESRKIRSHRIMTVGSKVVLELTLWNGEKKTVAFTRGAALDFANKLAQGAELAEQGMTPTITLDDSTAELTGPNPVDLGRVPTEVWKSRSKRKKKP